MELIVGALVVLGFLAILTRFLPRDASGGAVLPRIVDDSIGMYVLRRLTGRRLWERPLGDEAEGGAGRAAEAAAAAGAPGAAGPARVAPTRHVVSRSSRSLSVGSPARAGDRLPHAHRRRRAAAVLGSRIAAAGALAAVLLVAAGVVGSSVLPPGPQGDVLGETGLPGSSPPGTSVIALGPSVVPTPYPAPTDGPRPTRPLGPVEPTSTPTPAPTPTSRPTPRPAITPAPTPAPTPTSTPTPVPTPKATPTPTPAPTPTPTPTPTPLPLLVYFDWTADGTIRHFIDQSTSGATIVSWSWDFGDGGTSSAQHPTHDFASRADPYAVRLQVTDSLGRTDDQTRFVSVP